MMESEMMKGHPDRPLGSVMGSAKRREQVAVLGLVAVALATAYFFVSPSFQRPIQMAKGPERPAKSMAPSTLRESVEAAEQSEFWIEKLLSEPRIFILHNLITQDEIRRLIETAERKGMSEALITPYGSNNLVPSTTRTNTAAWLDFQQDDLVTKIESKIAEATGTRPEDAENLQVLHYADGSQYFQEHRDYFDPKEDPPENFEKGGNRMVTVITYLKTPKVGGDTFFTKIDLALKCKPGDAIVFWNLKPDGSVDPDTYHSALPPKEGQKWVAVKWIHERQYQALQPGPADPPTRMEPARKVELVMSRVAAAAR